jgi:hypothetical protein
MGDDAGDDADEEEEDLRVGDVDEVELARLVSAMEALAANTSADEFVERRSLRLTLGWWRVDAPYEAADGHGVVKSDSSDAADEDEDDVVSEVEQSCESMCAEADDDEEANALAAAVQPAERRRLSPTMPSVITSSSAAAADCDSSAAALGPVSPVLTLRGRRSGLTCRRLVGPRGACADWFVDEGDEGEEVDDVAEDVGWGSGSASALRLLPVVVVLVASSLISLR